MHYACRDILLKPMTFAGPNNYLQVPGFFRRPRMFVKFKFRSWDYTGLLMFTRFADDLGALELGLSEGQINVTIFQPGKKKLQFAAGGFICINGYNRKDHIEIFWSIQFECLIPLTGF